VELKQAYDLARSLLSEYGLGDWSVEFDRAKRRAGVCRHGTRVIGLSAPLTRLHPEAEVRDTILHEIAHALAGPQHQHDDVWRSIALSIGGTGERCVPEDVPRLVGDWTGICGAGHEADRHRRPDRVLLCRRCEGQPPERRVFEWTHRGRPAVMHPNYRG
jgi:predicted SprT family Zn-dependent metalloprotease